MNKVSPDRPSLSSGLSSVQVNAVVEEAPPDRLFAVPHIEVAKMTENTAAAYTVALQSWGPGPDARSGPGPGIPAHTKEMILVLVSVQVVVPGRSEQVSVPIDRSIARDLW